MIEIIVLVLQLSWRIAKVTSSSLLIIFIKYYTQNAGITLGARVAMQVNVAIDNYGDIEQVKGKLMV